MKPTATRTSLATGVLVILASMSLWTGCQSPAKPAATEKSAKVVAHCLKAAEPTDATLLVTQWKWHTSHVGHHDVNYFTFRYTPHSDDPCSYESVGALVCERYVTSHTPLPTRCQFAGKEEVITSIVVDKKKIVRTGTSGPLDGYTSECLCPKP